MKKKLDSSEEITVKGIKISKKRIVVIAVAVLITIAIGVTLILLLSNKNDGKTIRTSAGRVKIEKSETKKIECEDYDNSLISLKIPKGWKVEVAPFDYIHYSFKLYNPKDTNYMLLFGMKLEGFNKSEAARNWQRTY
jgi:hypothetical protein